MELIENYLNQVSQIIQEAGLKIVFENMREHCLRK